MGTRLNWTRTGLALVCETSTRAIPKTTPAPTEVPDFSRVTSPLVALTLETIPGTTRKGIRVRNIGAEDLPAGKSWTLWWAAYDTAPTVIPWEAIPLGQVARVDYLLTDPRPTSTHAFRLSDGTVTYPTVTVTTPADTIVGDVANATDLARQSGNLVKNPLSNMVGATGPEAIGVWYEGPAMALPSGSYYGRELSPASGLVQADITGIIPCAPGDKFLFEAKVFASVRNGFLTMRWKDRNGSGLDQSYATAYASGSWQATRCEATAPAGACGVVFQLESSGGAGYVIFDSIYAERKQVAALSAQAAADAAQTAASNAQNSANTANALLTDIASDGKLTPQEKQAARKEWDAIASEKAGIDTQADAFSVSRSAYDTNFQALATYLNAGTAWVSGVPSWLADANLGTTTDITGATFRATWKAYYDERTNLLNTIAAKAKALADAAQTTGNQINSVDYLANVDKITLRQQWDSEAYTQAQLNAQATSAGVSSTAYGNAIAALSTALVSAGAPSNWATTWPDGTTSGPWTGIATTTRNAWATIAQERAKLIGAIAAADATTKANNAQTSAVSTAANDALSKMNAAILQAQLHQVGWASSALPALPSGSYPAGYLAQTTDNRKFQVNAGGTAWGEITQAAVGIYGKIIAENLILANLDNLIPNPLSNIQPTPAGVSGNAVWYEGTTFMHSGSLYGRELNATTGTQADISTTIQCAAGDKFYWESWAVSSVRTGYMTVRWLDQNGARFAQSYVAIPANTGSWTKFTITATAPAGAVGLVFQIESSGGTGWVVFDQFYARRMGGAEMIVDGTIMAKIQAGDVIATSNFAAHTGGTNYTYSTIESTNPATVDSGALLRNGGSGIPSFLIGPSGMQVGSTLIGEALLRSLSMFGNNGGSVSGGTWLGWYLGNVTARNESGTDYYTPDTTCLKITSRWFGTANGTQCGQWDLILQPTAANSNLDGIRRVEMELYVSGTTTAYRTLYVDITDRGYESTTHSNTGNAIRQTATLVHGGSGYMPESANSYQGYIRARVVGANGPGKWLWYSPSPNGTEITGSTTTPSAVTGAPGSGGGSSGDGGGKVLDPII